MKLPLQITFKGMDSSEAAENAIRERAERLETFFSRIMSCHVIVEAPHRRQRQGRVYSVRIDLRIPGHEIAVSHSGPKDQAHEDVYVAIRDAFDAARRRMEDHARADRGDVKSHAAAR